MDILIVGGTGVISTAITNLLVARGDHVAVANRGQTTAALPPGVAQIAADSPAFEAAIAATGPWDCAVDMRTFTPAEAASTVRAFRGRTLGHTPALLATPERDIVAAYLPVGGTITFDPSLDHPKHARWFDPRTGDLRPATRIGDGYHAPEATDAAGHPEDWVLVMASDE